MEEMVPNAERAYGGNKPAGMSTRKGLRSIDTLLGEAKNELLKLSSVLGGSVPVG